MNPDFLPEIGASLRRLCEYGTRQEVTDETLAAVAAELEKARAAVAGARGQRRANRCTRHPGGPVDPTAGNGCLLCGTAQRRTQTTPNPAPVTRTVTLAEICQDVADHGHDEAVRQHGARMVTRALIHCHPDPNLTEESA